MDERWQGLPDEIVNIAHLVWPCHDINLAHVHFTPDVVVTVGPVLLEELVDGSLFVHDGRHRTIRARRQGSATIVARVLRH